MLSYHNDPAIKQKYLDRVKAHRIADEVEKGYYWEKGKGCAVGCTIHDSDHSKYEKELGIPIILAKLEDRIFEALPNGDAKLWPEQFLDAITPGVDLSSIWPKIVVWLLIDEKHGVINYIKKESQKEPIIHVAKLYSDYKNVTLDEWKYASFAADAAADAADDAAVDATSSAYYADAYDAAARAAYKAAYYAARSAYNASCAAYYAYNASYAAYYAYYAAAANKENHTKAQADKLLSLLKEAN